MRIDRCAIPSRATLPRGEGESFPPLFEMSRGWIDWTGIRKTRDGQLLFLLPAGEGQDEGERQNPLDPVSRVGFAEEEVSLNARPHPALSPGERENPSPAFCDVVRLD